MAETIHTKAERLVREGRVQLARSPWLNLNGVRLAALVQGDHDRYDVTIHEGGRVTCQCRYMSPPFPWLPRRKGLCSHAAAALIKAGDEELLAAVRAAQEGAPVEAGVAGLSRYSPGMLELGHERRRRARA